jgi:hypothetical protein
LNFLKNFFQDKIMTDNNFKIFKSYKNMRQEVFKKLIYHKIFFINVI